jgi:hypothetical protein
VFAKTTYGDRNLFACSQAGLVNNLNDGMSWGVFPLFFANFGLGVGRIGILKAVYPAVWGTLQVATGPLSDRWGRKGLIVAGMWVRIPYEPIDIFRIDLRASAHPQLPTLRTRSSPRPEITRVPGYREHFQARAAADMPSGFPFGRA